MLRLKVVLVVFWGCCLALTSCDDTSTESDYLPSAIVDFEIDINLPQYFSLREDRGFAFVNGEGDRGIILYRKSSSEITALESNCSYMPNAQCANVLVDETGLFLVDSCCKSTFDFSGLPKSGPATGRLFSYTTSLQDDVLRVSN